MQPGTIKTLVLVLALMLALRTASLRAQTFTAPLQASTTGTNPVDFEFRADGTMIAKGNLGVGSLLSTDQGAGTRLLWFPDLAAFRAGNVNGTQWNLASIGQGSVGFGIGTIASSYVSAAFGYSTTASGYGSTALGAHGIASGTDSTVLGYGSTASGYAAIASGYYSTATGVEAVATGAGTTASGAYAFTIGAATVASGKGSAAFGKSTTAPSLDSLTLGTYNLGTNSTGGAASATTWVATDPIFEVGNGTSTTKSDALVLYKNGNMAVQGVVTVAPGGDIPMYTGS